MVTAKSNLSEEIVNTRLHSRLRDEEKWGLAYYIINLRLFNISLKNNQEFFFHPDLCDALRRLLINYKKYQYDTLDNILSDFQIFLKNNIDILFFGNQNLSIEIQRFHLNHNSNDSNFLNARRAVFECQKDLNMKAMQEIFLFLSKENLRLLNNTTRKINLGDLREVLLFMIAHSNLKDVFLGEQPNYQTLGTKHISFSQTEESKEENISGGYVYEELVKWVGHRPDNKQRLDKHLNFQHLREEQSEYGYSIFFLNYLEITFNLKREMNLAYKQITKRDAKDPYFAIDSEIVNTQINDEDGRKHREELRNYFAHRFATYADNSGKQLFTRVGEKLHRIVKKNSNKESHKHDYPSQVQIQERNNHINPLRKQIAAQYKKEKEDIDTKEIIKAKRKTKILTDDEEIALIKKRDDPKKQARKLARQKTIALIGRTILDLNPINLAENGYSFVKEEIRPRLISRQTIIKELSEANELFQRENNIGKRPKEIDEREVFSELARPQNEQKLKPQFAPRESQQDKKIFTYKFLNFSLSLRKPKFPNFPHIFGQNTKLEDNETDNKSTTITPSSSHSLDSQENKGTEIVLADLRGTKSNINRKILEEKKHEEFTSPAETIESKIIAKIEENSIRKQRSQPTLSSSLTILLKKKPTPSFTAKICSTQEEKDTEIDDINFYAAVK